MSLSFEFATAGRIVFGEGMVREVPGALRAALEAAGVTCIPFAVRGEPTIDVIRSAPRDGDMVIAMGGGSVLDTGKALAAMRTNPGDPLDYLEVIGRGLPLAVPAAP